MKTTVAADFGDGEQLDSAQMLPGQLGQVALELGPRLLVLGGAGIANGAQLAKVDVRADRQGMEMPPKDQRLFRCPTLSASGRTLMVSASTSPCETASSHRLNLVEDEVLGRTTCLIV